MKKILFVANTDWYLFNFRWNLLEAARKNGFSIQLACSGHKHAEKLEEAGYPVHSIPFDTPGINFLSELKALLTLGRVIRKTDPDIVHLFTLKCVLYGCLCSMGRGSRKRMIGAITGMGHLFTTRSWRTQLLRPPVLWAMKIALRMSNCYLIFQNSADRDEFVKNKLIKLECTEVIRGSGVDCNRFQAAIRQPTDNPVTFLFCGRLLKEKGITEYLSATDNLYKSGVEFRSIIAGAPYPSNPSSLSEAEVDKLRQDSLHDYLGHAEDMAPLFAKADIVVLPTYREGTPKALLEAAASGCIIVTTDIPGCEGIVDPGLNGELVPARTVAPLTEALRKLIQTTPAERIRMSKHSRQIALERFSDVHVNRQTMAAYKRLQ